MKKRLKMMTEKNSPMKRKTRRWDITGNANTDEDDEMEEDAQSRKRWHQRGAEVIDDTTAVTRDEDDEEEVEPIIDEPPRPTRGRG